MAENTAVRLNKYLAECGVCSRREADQRIAEGKVIATPVDNIICY